ncbi:hypothetical protein HZS_6549 [Henneguya salminicola]|nr:hypothetical protein HZS_6549 [Henneguya salminicola]
MDTFKQFIISTASDNCIENIDQENLLQYPCSAIIYSFDVIALNLKNFNLKFRFMQDMLEIYIQLSANFRKISKASSKSSYLAVFMNHIIRSLSYIMQRIGQITNVTPQIQQLFKNFWVYLVVMGSININDSTFDVLQYYKEISTFSPPLVVDHLRSDLQYNTSIEDNSLDSSDLTVTRNLLIKCLECSNQIEISNIIMRLPALHVVFLTAIYEQESLAVEKDTSRFPHLFLYLEDSALEKDKQSNLSIINLKSSMPCIIFQRSQILHINYM